MLSFSFSYSESQQNISCRSWSPAATSLYFTDYLRYQIISHSQWLPLSICSNAETALLATDRPIESLFKEIACLLFAATKICLQLVMFSSYQTGCHGSRGLEHTFRQGTLISHVHCSLVICFKGILTHHRVIFTGKKFICKTNCTYYKKEESTSFNKAEFYRIDHGEGPWSICS